MSPKTTLTIFLRTTAADITIYEIIKNISVDVFIFTLLSLAI